MIKKKPLITLSIVIILLISISLFYTYAIDVSMNQTTGDADMTFNINLSDPSSRTVTVPAGKTKMFDLFITNSNGATINYGIAYSGTKPDTVKIAQVNSSKDTVSGTIANNTTKQITIVIENKSSTDYTYTLQAVTGYENGGNLIVPSGYTLITDIYTTLPATATDYIKSLSQGTSWSSGASGVYATSSYDDNGTTKYHEYRYVGANVHNYVKFNNDMYRIIGVFDDNSHGVTGQWLVKLIAANPLGDYSWGATNTASAYTTYSTYNNNWETANANILLNEYFLNATDTSSTYKSCSDWTYYFSSNNYKTKDCSDIIGYGIQTANLRNYIEPVTWYLKGFDSNSYSKADFYNCERGITTGDATKDSNCTSGNSGAYAASVTSKNVGLMYLSDYLYASGYYSSTNTTSGSFRSYGQQNWLYKVSEWTITPRGSASNSAFYVSGGFVDSNGTIVTNALRPTFYLKSTIKIKSGTGSFDNPYVIG